MVREEIRGLLFAMHGQRHNRIKDNFVALKLRYLLLEIAIMLNNFTISDIKNYFIQIASAEDGARRDFKSVREPSYQLFKGERPRTESQGESWVSLYNYYFYR